ncbi:MAG: hypothetical protein Rhirs2KO_33720 [Rhizobiaceae bacterium]
MRTRLSQALAQWHSRGERLVLMIGAIHVVWVLAVGTRRVVAVRATRQSDVLGLG